MGAAVATPTLLTYLSTQQIVRLVEGGVGTGKIRERELSTCELSSFEHTSQMCVYSPVSPRLGDLEYPAAGVK